MEKYFVRTSRHRFGGNVSCCSAALAENRPGLVWIETGLEYYWTLESVFRMSFTIDTGGFVCARCISGRLSTAVGCNNGTDAKRRWLIDRLGGGSGSHDVGGPRRLDSVTSHVMNDVTDAVAWQRTRGTHSPRSLARTSVCLWASTAVCCARLKICRRAYFRWMDRVTWPFSTQ